MKISFVIPCYKSELTIGNVVNEIIGQMSTAPEMNYEFILVDDCSPDNTWGVIKELAEANPEIKGIQLMRNFGQHAALMAGFGASSGDMCFCLDDDGQAPVESIFALIEELEKGYDIVYGHYPDMKQSAFRRFGSWVNKKMNEVLAGVPKGPSGSSFFVCRRAIIDEIIKYDKSYPYVAGLVFRTTQRVSYVNVNQRERAAGQSGYNLKKLLSLWTNGCTTFSVKPLKLSITCGAIAACAGFVYGIVLIIKKIINPLVPIGYSSLMVALLVIGGLIMIMLGLVGEYVGRIYMGVNNTPQYVVRETKNILRKEK